MLDLPSTSRFHTLTWSRSKFHPFNFENTPDTSHHRCSSCSGPSHRSILPRLWCSSLTGHCPLWAKQYIQIMSVLYPKYPTVPLRVPRTAARLLLHLRLNSVLPGPALWTCFCLCSPGTSSSWIHLFQDFAQMSFLLLNRVFPLI